MAALIRRPVSVYPPPFLGRADQIKWLSYALVSSFIRGVGHTKLLVSHERCVTCLSFNYRLIPSNSCRLGCADLKFRRGESRWTPSAILTDEGGMLIYSTVLLCTHLNRWSIEVLTILYVLDASFPWVCKIHPTPWGWVLAVSRVHVSAVCLLPSVPSSITQLISSYICNKICHRF